MRKKYRNEKEVPLFGKYNDPFKVRRGVGPQRPDKPLSSVEPFFKRKFAEDVLYYCWLGHSSVFLHFGSLSIMVDPVFSKFVSPVPFMGPKRYPGRKYRESDFDVIDVVLITHSHYDHLDKKTIKELDHKIKDYVVPKDVSKILLSFGVREDKIHELGWYESIKIKETEIVLTPSQHDSARGPFSMDASLWGGYLLRNEDFTVFDSGDGGYAEHFKRIHELYGPVDLAIMECGQYNDKWHAIHMFPEESVEAALDLGAKLATPVHYGAYTLSDHPYYDPPKRFKRYAEEKGLNFKIADINSWIVIDKKR